MKQIDFNTLMADAKRFYRTPTETPECPPAETLVDLYHGDLPAADGARLRSHTGGCERCRVELMKMESDHTAWRMITRAIAAGLPATASPTEAAAAFTSAISSRLVRWVSELWEPDLLATAAAETRESREYSMEHGEFINLTCHWQAGDRHGAPRLHLAWNAYIQTFANLWVRFVNPVNREVLHEAFLGDRLSGEKRFSREELGFDPSRQGADQKWAISIILEEKAD